MQKSLQVIVMVALALSALGCSVFSAVPPTDLPPTPTEVPPTQAPPTVDPTETPQPTEPAIPALTAAQLKNAEYHLPQYDKTVTLVNGTYETGTLAGADYISAVLLDKIAFGDLNQDGAEDAVVLLAENGGGTGVFVSVVVMLNQNGEPQQSSAIMIDDRPAITSLSIEDGQISVTAVIHGIDDPGCCPNFPVTETFAWTPKGLTLARLSSQTPNGKTRALTLEHPAPGTNVSGSVQVQGSFTISPFENSLAYRVVDAEGNPLAEGAIMANSDGVGGPGTFDAPIDLTAIASGAVISLEILDLSAADGSPLAMDSVVVNVK